MKRRDLFPNSDDRPAEVFIPLFSRGCDALDVTVTSPVQVSQILTASPGGRTPSSKEAEEQSLCRLMQQRGGGFFPPGCRDSWGVGGGSHPSPEEAGLPFRVECGPR
jgi:hypothetical protein